MSHSGSVLALVSASGGRYHNISAGICHWKCKRILENKIFCPTCHVRSSCLSYLSLLDDRSLLQNMSQGAKLRPDSLSPDPRTAQSVISLKSRETEKYFTKYSKVFNICLPGCHSSCQYSCKNIYKHITRQNWLTNVDEGGGSKHLFIKMNKNTLWGLLIKACLDLEGKNICVTITRRDFCGKKLINVGATHQHKEGNIS